MLNVSLQKGRDETLVELNIPAMIFEITENVRGVYLIAKYNEPIYLCADGATYYTPYEKRLPPYNHAEIILTEGATGITIKVDGIARFLAVDPKYKYASSVWLSSEQCAIVYSIVTGDIDEWPYTLQQYTMEIVGEGRYKSGHIADIMACEEHDGDDLPPLERSPNQINAYAVCFKISASNDSIYLFNQSHVFQIRLSVR